MHLWTQQLRRLASSVQGRVAGGVAEGVVAGVVAAARKRMATPLVRRTPATKSSHSEEATPGWRFDRCLRNSNQLVSLQAESPLRVMQAVVDCHSRITLALAAIHRLKKEMCELQFVEELRHGSSLRVDQLQLVATS